jgi:hypothetical protein
VLKFEKKKSVAKRLKYKSIKFCFYNSKRYFIFCCLQTLLSIFVVSNKKGTTLCSVPGVYAMAILEYCNKQYTTRISLTEFAVLVSLYTYVTDDDVVEVGTCTRNISGILLYVTDCAICWIRYCLWT